MKTLSACRRRKISMQHSSITKDITLPGKRSGNGFHCYLPSQSQMKTFVFPMQELVLSLMPKAEPWTWDLHY